MDWSPIDENLKTRKEQSLFSLVGDKVNSSGSLILQSSNDLGVVRNGGRRGSAYAPKSITNTLLKMAKRDKANPLFIKEVCGPKDQSFEDMVQQSITSMTEALVKSQKTTINIGGGHDHAYPFIKSLLSVHESVSIINLDAHLDTRSDGIYHSGTPFRQLKEEFKERINLYQVGIHDFANVDENYRGIQMKIDALDTIKKVTKGFRKNKKYIKGLFENIPSNGPVILSLDLDAITGHEMKAVSAVNHDGLPISFVCEVYDYYRENYDQYYLGLYEYNPQFDDLGMSCARSICSLIYPFL